MAAKPLRVSRARQSTILAANQLEGRLVGELRGVDFS